MNRVFAFFASLLLVLSVLYGYFYATAAMASERRIPIAIVDTGVRPGHEEYYCENGVKDYTGEGIYDVNGHGSNIAGIIASYVSPKTHCFMILKWYHSPAVRVLPAAAINYAVAHNAKYINLSFYGEQPSLQEQAAIGLALLSGIHVIVSAGNESHDLGVSCNAYPACYPFPDTSLLSVVGNAGADTSNYGGPVNDLEPGNGVLGWFGLKMSGSSQAAAIKTAKLAKSGS